jgi:hypothetical protein
MSSFKVFSQGLCGKQKNPSNTNNKIKKGWHLSLIQTLTIVNHLYTLQSFHSPSKELQSPVPWSFFLRLDICFSPGIFISLPSSNHPSYTYTNHLVGWTHQIFQPFWPGVVAPIHVNERDSYIASKDCMMS